jgi:hypothetical protein
MATKKNTTKRTQRAKSERAVDLILSMPMGELVAMIQGIAHQDPVTARFLSEQLSGAVESSQDDQS